ncbi:MAG: DNA polymerase III subunit alpha, partial [Patescibacteria group bacterium]|nr:DNA polymerase III subunit alpha [Patescibacteria group bacterium]
MSKFVHLHTHSHYSLLDGLGKIPDLVLRAKELGMDALALTDHGSMYGMIEFYKTCKKHEIKPIIGVEVYLAIDKMTDKRPRIDDKRYHLVLLAENDEGYKNLLKITSIGHLEGFYYKPRVDKDVLRKYSKGVIALSACLAGEIPRAFMNNDNEKAERVALEYAEIFGRENFYLELQHHPEMQEQQKVNEQMIELSKKTGLGMVVTKDIHYVLPEDAEAQDALLCIQTGKTVDDPTRLTMRNEDYSMTSPEVIAEAFGHVPSSLENTVKIAERCNVELDLGKDILPTFKTPEGVSDADYLRQLCEEGLKKRYKEITPRIRERLEFELSTIERMGYASYFLIVQDFVNFAKREGIVVGPGRGSAAGSIVSYVLGVTDIDPIHYKLLFERFLNPDRISMPDIDLDFSDIKRHKVIEYVTKKYGEDKVAGIITFGTMMARAVVRDVGRVLGIPYAEVDSIAKLIPPPQQGRHVPLPEHIKKVSELNKLYKENAQIKHLIDLSTKLEGTIRHASQHACGVVISDKPLPEYTALQRAQGGDVEIVTQYSLHPIEDVGLLKMDFLGLANLSIIQDTLEIVEAIHQKKVDINNIPLDDKKTFELLSRAETTGVFQLESAGMKRYIKELKPTNIEDIIAMVALYRPGPLQFIDSFIKRKNGHETIEYMHPKMENALKNTYGIPVYQEQVMQISKDFAGFTGGEADTLRKAMGKKIAKLMAEMKVKFVEGAVANGAEPKLASAIFQKLEDFAAYGFNRSHAACYAMIAYRTAYLKAHWPNCFMAALMNSDSGNLDRITIEVGECRAIGLDVLSPDINESFPRFTVVPNTNKIRFGLLAIKNVGSDIVEVIITERKKNGKFKNLSDFVSRIQSKNFNKKSLESMIKSGAMDSVGERGQLLANVELILEHNREVQKNLNTCQTDIFSLSSTIEVPGLRLREIPPALKEVKLKWEKELLGLYITEHPFGDFAEALGESVVSCQNLSKIKQRNIKIGGMISSMKQIQTKKNEPMIFAKLEDMSGQVEIIVFPRVL